MLHRFMIVSVVFSPDIMIKPDGVQRRLVGNIIGRFESKGLTLKAMKLATPSQQLLEEHYDHLKDMPFFSKIIKFMCSGPVVSMVSQFASADAPS
jgi:nucleoside-diphosphate kinase